MAASYNFPLGISEHDPNFRRIRQIIEGFRGYENIDDLKAADRQVREQLARELERALGMADAARQHILRQSHLQVMPDFDVMAGHIGMAAVRLLRPTARLEACTIYRPEESRVRQLYDLDFRMLSASENAFNLMQEFQRMVREDMMLANIHKIDVSLSDIQDCMDKKEQSIYCMIG